MNADSDQEVPAPERAGLFYRPEYERLRWGDRTLHLFWFRDRSGRRTHQMILRDDPREPARGVKADLNRLTRAEFEVKYAPFRLEAPPERGDSPS